MFLLLQHRGKPFLRNLALCALALAAGCGANTFLRITKVPIDRKLELLLGGGGNTTVLVHGREALVADVKLADYALRLRHEVEDELGRRVSRILLTHAHFDHAGGLSLFPDVGAVLVHPNARRRLEAEGKSAPWVEVEREVRLLLGGEEVRVLYLGVGHTNGDLVALLPARRLLVSGDLFATASEPSVDERYGGNILELMHTVDRLLELDFERVVPGHGEVTSRAGVERLSAYLHALYEAVKQQVAAGKHEDEAVAAVRLPEFDDLKSTPFLTNRAANVRRMWRSLCAECGPAPAAVR